MGLPAVTVDRISAPGPHLNSATVPTLLGEFDAALQRGARGIVIDLSLVVSMDWAGVSALTAIHRRASAHTRLALAALRRDAQKAARITCLHEIFDIYETVDGALSAMSRNPSARPTVEQLQRDAVERARMLPGKTFSEATQRL
jgi:anti-sigma B factor antagonist